MEILVGLTTRSGNPINNRLRIGIHCRACGKLFKMHLSVYLNGRKACSFECRNRLKKKYPYTAICKNCKKTFKLNPCKSLEFCNRQCWREYQKKKGKRQYICKQCGKIVTVYKHRNYYDYRSGKKEIRKYCSQICSNKAKEGKIGKGVGSWKGGMVELQDIIRKSSYYRKLRTECFKRDKYRSIISGKNGGRLQHHHLCSYSILFDIYSISNKNWINYFDILFDLNNVVTLTTKEHKNFHHKYGKITTPEQFEEFKQTYTN